MCEFINNRNGIQQGNVFKIDIKDDTANVGANFFEVRLFNKHGSELVNSMIILREKVFGANGTFPTAFSDRMSDS